MLKILLLIALAFVAALIFRAYKRTLDKPAPPPRDNQPENMVKCAHCGVNMPRSEAIFSGGDFYCTPEHQKLGRK